MDRSELSEVEDLEYADAIEALALNPHFKRFLVRWVLDARDNGSGGIITPNSLPHANYLNGRASSINEFMAGLEVTHPDVHDQVSEELRRYARRRIHADSDSGPDDGDSGSDVGPYDPGDAE